MRSVIPILLSFCILIGCKQGQKHPQAELINRNTADSLSEKDIVAYADSIDAAIATLDKTVSLVYISGESTFHVERFSYNGQNIVFVKDNRLDNNSSSLTKYYFKQDSLILIKEYSKNTLKSPPLLTDKRTFLRKNIPFKESYRTATSLASLTTLPLKEKMNNNIAARNFQDSVSMLSDALNGKNRFELVFDQYIPNADGGSLVLKSKIPGGYSASISVRETDGLVDSLTADPLLFKDQTLKFKWILRNNENIYVPVSITSAKGLKR